MKLMVLCIVVLASASMAAGEATPKQPKSHTGTYIVNRGNGAGGTLMVIDSGGKSSFSLECDRGAPAYNSGMIQGNIDIKGGIAEYRTQEFGGLCRIKIKFFHDSVSVTQEGSDSDCGFGYGVYCDGTYALKNRKKPKFPEM